VSVPRRHLPGDPSERCLHFAFRDDLYGTLRSETLERWEVSIRHRRETHDDGDAGLVARDARLGEVPAAVASDVYVGQMVFYLVHPDRGMNAYVMTPRLARPAVAVAA
jgi:hypothetical protein